VDLAGIVQVAKIFRLVVRAAYIFPRFKFPTAIYRRLPSDNALSHSEFEEEMDLCYLCWWIQPGRSTSQATARRCKLSERKSLQGLDLNRPAFTVDAFFLSSLLYSPAYISYRWPDTYCSVQLETTRTTSLLMRIAE
jgi:hypothetical protein